VISNQINNASISVQTVVSIMGVGWYNTHKYHRNSNPLAILHDTSKRSAMFSCNYNNEPCFL